MTSLSIPANESDLYVRPADRSGIIIQGDNKWKTIIENANKNNATRGT